MRVQSGRTFSPARETKSHSSYLVQHLPIRQGRSSGASLATCWREERGCLARVVPKSWTVLPIHRHFPNTLLEAYLGCGQSTHALIPCVPRNSGYVHVYGCAAFQSHRSTCE